MQMTMRWYGPDDPVTLAHIRQIPGVTGIVSALHDIPIGEIWPLEQLQARKAAIEAAGLRFAVIESIPAHEAIKLGSPERDRWLENYRQSVRNMRAVGVEILCYNFMPIFDWMRTQLAMPLPDGSTALSFAQHELEAIDLTQGTGALPGWSGAYDRNELDALLAQYRDINEETLFDNLVYFLRAVVPVAEEVGVYMAIHPDDPPWPIFGLPRIVRDATTIQRLLNAVESPHHGLTFCTGSLGAAPDNDLAAMIHQFCDRIRFVHARNVKITGHQIFHEAQHPSRFGDVDMAAIMRALANIGYTGPIRPDHGRMIWNETGRPGYGLYDRALGAMYLQGLWEGISE